MFIPNISLQAAVPSQIIAKLSVEIKTRINVFFYKRQVPFNPLTDEQNFNALQNLTSVPFFSSLLIYFVQDAKRSVRRLIVLHQKSNI